MSRAEKKVKRARFSIRDLLLMTVLAGLGMAWWIDRSRLASEVEKLEKRLKADERIIEVQRATIVNFRS
jgi:hypothetical protein